MGANQDQPPRLFHYCFLAAAAAFLYLELFVLPATPITGTDNDQSLYLHNAMKMLDGQMIYRDFFQFTPPGTELVYLVLFKMCGVRAWIPNVTLLVLGLGLTWLYVYISHSVLSGLTAYLPGLMFLVLAFHPVLDGSHHWFSMLAVTAATALIIKERNLTRVAGAGALCALASFFTQPRGLGVVAGLALFLWWAHRKKPQGGGSLLRSEGILAGVFITVTAALNLYFVWAVGWRSFLWSIVVFGVKYYPAEAGLNSLRAYMAYVPMVAHVRHVPEPSWLFIHALLPLVYLLFFARCWREFKQRPDQPWDRLMLVNLMGSFLFLGVAPAPVYWRLCVVSPPGVVILAWFLGSHGTLPGLARKVLWLSAGVALVGFALYQQTRWRGYLNGPIGRGAFFERGDYQKYAWLLSHTRPSEAFFDCSGQAYFFFGRTSPAAVSFLTSTDYTRPKQVLDVIRSLEENRVPVVLWYTDLDPGMGEMGRGGHLEPLRDYLRAHYHVAGVPESPVRVLERNGGSAGE
jgi:hypothetical protein